jgi:hypothetical protein
VARQRTLLDEEAGVVAGIRQTARLLRRGLRRPLLSTVLAILVAAVLVGLLALQEHQFAPRLVLRAVEMDHDPVQAPRLKRHLREYVLGAVFTSRPLYELIVKHGLYPGLFRKNPRAALESFREDIDVEVYQNYFIEERSEHDAPRSARVAIRYRSSDRQLALQVTRDLGTLLVEHEAKFRREQSRKAAEAARHGLQVAERELANRRVALGDARQRIGSADDHRAEVEFVSLTGSLPMLEARVAEAARLKAAFDLGAAFEKKQLGLVFELVDGGGIPASEGIDRRDCLLLGAVFFVLGFPLVALGVGAFKPTRQDGNEQGVS